MVTSHLPGGGARNALIAQHLPLADTVAALLKRRYHWLEFDELRGYAYLGLTLAARVYQPKRGLPFDVFAMKKAAFLAVDQMRRDRLLSRPPSGKYSRRVFWGSLAQKDDLGPPDVSDKRLTQDETISVESRDMAAQLLACLPDRDRRIMLMYYADELTFKEIGRALGMSESMVCVRHRIIVEKVRRRVRPA